MAERDWHKDPLSRNTKNDDGYKNTQNVRRFFKSHCGNHFKFDRSLMLWVKSNQGCTMGDAVTE